jgi:hypothetical protein
MKKVRGESERERGKRDTSKNTGRLNVNEKKEEIIQQN